MLKGVAPEVALGRDTKLLKEILDKTAEHISKDLTNMPEVEAELRFTLGNTYYQLRELEKAEAMHREALRLRRAVFGGNNELVAASLRELGRVLGDLGRVPETESVLREAVNVIQQLPGDHQEDFAHSLYLLGDVIRHEGKLAEARDMLRQAVDIIRARCPTGNKWMPGLLSCLADVLERRDNLTEAEALQREALDMSRRFNPNDSDQAFRLGLFLKGLGRLTEAEPLLREGYEQRKKNLGNDHPFVASAVDALSWVLIRQGKMTESELLLCEDIATRRRTKPDAKLANSLDRLSLVLRMQGKLTDAGSVRREALKIWMDAAENGKADAMNDAAWYIATSEGSTSEQAQRAVDLAEKAVAATKRKDPNMLDTLAAAYARLGQFAKAVALQEEALRQMAEPKDQNGFVSRLKLYQANKPYGDSADVACANEFAAWASWLLSEKRFAEAESLGRKSLVIREKELPEHWSTFNIRSMVGEILFRQNKYTEAEPFIVSGYEGLKQRYDRIPEASKHHLKEALQRLVLLYEATNRSTQATDHKLKLPELEKNEIDQRIAATPPR